MVNISVRDGNIAQCHRCHCFVRGLAKFSLEHRDEVREGFSAMIAQVEDLFRRTERKRGDDAANNVIDVCEVSPHAAARIDLDRPAVRDAMGKGEVRHVWSAPRAVHGEETKPGDRQTIQRVVHMGDRFVRFLGGRIERAGVVDAVGLGEWDL
eukprot:CAMPEP_0182846444 /NCGR_PEP_ID=MMETSP0006_2-20121128/27897_1 /TAXON_ID=97485 /ORGANISM="Prymnesium parvum, Strain Texoma1" /LENGTH=152 /DNA_ID=CAMNT_0024976649 /DNA_START=169 /DNA_END=623 /DNA_ORIENTATION=+